MLSVRQITFNPVQENTYLVYNEQKQCCIIDPGPYFPEERDELKTVIEKTGLKPVLLLNTHCHLDHIFGNKFVYETWGLPVHLHRLEQPVLEDAPRAGVEYELPFDNYAGPLFTSKKATGSKSVQRNWKSGLHQGIRPEAFPFITRRGTLSSEVMSFSRAVSAELTWKAAISTFCSIAYRPNSLPCLMRQKSIPGTVR